MYICGVQEKIRSIGVFYVSLIPEEKSLFLKILAVQYGVDHHLVEHIASQFKASAVSVFIICLAQYLLLCSIRPESFFVLYIENSFIEISCNNYCAIL